MLRADDAFPSEITLQGGHAPTLASDARAYVPPILRFMPSRIAQVAIDAQQPQVIAEFWCAVLGWVVHDIEDDIVWCIGPADGS